MTKQDWAHPRGCATRVLLYALLVVPASGQAQVLSLKEAIGRTLSEYPLIRQRQAEIENSEAGVTLAKDQRLPSLTLQEQWTAGTNNSVNSAYFGMGIVPSTVGGVATTNVWQANSGNVATTFLQWNVYRFGYYNALERQALTDLEATRTGLDRDKYLLTMEVAGLYLDALKKARLVEVERDNVSRNEAILVAIRAIAAGGLRPGVDSVTAAAQFADALLAFEQAQSDLTSDKIALSRFTGLDTAGVTPDTLLPEHLQTVSAGLLQPVENVPVTHPLLAGYQARYRATVAENKTIAREYLPTVGLEAAGWSRSSSVGPDGAYGDFADGFGYQRYSYLVGLSITYNVFDIKKRHDRLKAGGFAAEASKDALADEQLALDKDIQLASASYATAVRQLQDLRVQRAAALEAYGQQLALYKGGMATLIDVTNALYVLRRSETSYVITQDQLLQLLSVKAGLGNRLDAFIDNLN
ncbi:MAG TPA: TolC family protein [Dinghuibacter sp.]|uniref:TolC family protein n=1 Tax=Dinghuibacter sp. TaxID=2024697 RepID=UPI002B98685D|nr:TolC family protein [Dinghuibacter sp.]HTJ11583.1 TolC family protein [Dinghuibacter sp.]